MAFETLVLGALCLGSTGGAVVFPVYVLDRCCVADYRRAGDVALNVKDPKRPEPLRVDYTKLCMEERQCGGGFLESIKYLSLIHI